MTNWKPIETAPKDGCDLLLAWKSVYLENTWRIELRPYSNEDVGKRGTIYMHAFATHWMPVPEPPR